MPLPDGLHPLPPGKLASIVTYFEMRAAPADALLALPDGIVIAETRAPDPGWYRAFYRRVGTDWLWFARLALSDAELAALLARPSHRILTMTRAGEDVGFAELDGDAPGEVEIVYFGLVREATGAGLGRALMAAALAAAWGDGVARVWLRTCNVDDPRAIAFYRRMGFEPCGQAIDIADDPRLTGLLPAGTAPQSPLIRPA